MSNRERRQALAYEVVRLQGKGRSQREIARALSIARKTVKRLLDEQEQRRQKGESAVAAAAERPRLSKGSKLDEFDEKIRAWLAVYPNLTAVRCREKLQEEKKGLECGYTIVRERLKRLRAPKVPATAQEVETTPGQRIEFDWSPYVLGDGLKVQLWNATLMWSRAACLAGETNTRQTTILDRLRWSFETLGGVTRECLTDSMPGVVDRWEADLPVLNIRAVDFAAHYRLTVLIAPRGCPQFKARCERRFRYHEENLLNGRKIRTLEEYRTLLEWWQREKSMRRPHPETRREIGDMLEEERAYLSPLPAKPYDTRDVFVRLVSPTSHVHHETNEYALPDGHVGRRVYVCAGPDRIEICDVRAQVLIGHERLPDGARIRQAQLDSAPRRDRYDVDGLVERLAEWGEVAGDFARGVRRARRYAGPELVRLLNLQLSWNLDDVVAAMKHAWEYGCFAAQAVQRILEVRFTPRRFEELMAESTRRRIQEVMKEHPIEPRPLASYETLRHGDRPDPNDGEDGDEGKTGSARVPGGGSDGGTDPGRTGGPAPAADAPERG
jgi:transposase